MPLIVLMLACATIRPDFDAARAAALAEPDRLEEGWTADVELQLSAPLVEELLDEAIPALPALTKKLKIGPASATPRLRLSDATLRASRDSGALVVDLELDGRVAWALGPADGRVPLGATAKVEAWVDAVKTEDGWATQVQISRVREMTIEAGGEVAAISNIEAEVRSWLDQALLAAPPIPLSVVGGDGLPLRALRFRPGGRGVRLLGKTDTPIDAEVPLHKGMPDGGFRLSIAEASLLALARREAFLHGPVGYDVVPEPTALTWSRRGFDLGLRLWRPVGRGWWRDYLVVGSAKVDGRFVHLDAESVTEAGKSKGAALADALAALGEGVILRTLEKAIDAAVPSTISQTVGGVDLIAEVDDVGPGVGGAVVVSGSARAH